MSNRSRDRVAVGACGLVATAGQLVDLCADSRLAGAGRLELGGQADLDGGLVVPALPGQDQGELAACPGVGGVDGEDPPDGRLDRGGAVGAQPFDPRLVQGVVVREPLAGPGEVREGLGPAAGLGEPAGDGAVGVNGRRLGLEHLHPQVERAGQVAAAPTPGRPRPAASRRADITRGPTRAARRPRRTRRATPGPRRRRSADRRPTVGAATTLRGPRSASARRSSCASAQWSVRAGQAEQRSQAAEPPAKERDGVILSMKVPRRLEVACASPSSLSSRQAASR